jgi:hypothetical protein
LFSFVMSFRLLNALISRLLCPCICLWFHFNGCSAAVQLLNALRCFGPSGSCREHGLICH